MPTVKITRQFKGKDCQRLRQSFPLICDNKERIADIITGDNRYEWTLTPYSGQAFVTNVTFIGQTGRGKSTTINKIVGENLLSTDDIHSCTKVQENILFHLKDKAWFSVCDMPGIGESDAMQNQYNRWYIEMAEDSDVIVYVLNADQSDYRIYLDCFNTCLKGINRSKVIIAINKIEKLFPRYYDNNDIIRSIQTPKAIRDANHIKPHNIRNRYSVDLNKKIESVSRLFDIPQSRIIEYSALEGMFISDLKDMITTMLFKNLAFGI